jgi:hypothetical protein
MLISKHLRLQVSQHKTQRLHARTPQLSAAGILISGATSRYTEHCARRRRPQEPCARRAPPQRCRPRGVRPQLSPQSHQHLGRPPNTPQRPARPLDSEIFSPVGGDNAVAQIAQAVQACRCRWCRRQCVSGTRAPALSGEAHSRNVGPHRRQQRQAQARIAGSSVMRFPLDRRGSVMHQAWVQATIARRQYVFTVRRAAPSAPPS